MPTEEEHKFCLETPEVCAHNERKIIIIMLIFMFEYYMSYMLDYNCKLNSLLNRLSEELTRHQYHLPV